MRCKITEKYRIYGLSASYFCASRRPARNILIDNHLQTALRKAVFRLAKDGKLQRKRPPFAGQKAAFCKTADKHRETHRQQRARQPLMKNNTSEVLLYARHGVINTERPLKTSRTKRKTKNDYKRQRHTIHGEGRKTQARTQEITWVRCKIHRQSSNFKLSERGMTITN